MQMQGMSGDFNAKHNCWGSRINNHRGNIILNLLRKRKLKIISQNRPTHWPTNAQHSPDIIDFAVTNFLPNINRIYTEIDLTSDHVPIIFVVNTKPQFISSSTLTSKSTHWPTFQKYIDTHLTCNVPMRNEEDIEKAVETLTTLIQAAAFQATPPRNEIAYKYEIVPNTILQKRKEKRKATKQWQKYHSAETRRKMNKLNKLVKDLLMEHKNKKFQVYVENLDIIPEKNYSLWKTVKNIKNPIKQITPFKTNNGYSKDLKEQTEIAANYLEEIFSNNRNNQIIQSNSIHNRENSNRLEEYQMITSVGEVKNHIKQLKNKKAPGYDLINGQIIKELPDKAIRYLTILYNAILRLGNCIFTDIEKAFDKVSHSILRDILARTLTRPLSHILSSYLTNRHFFIKLNDTYSEVRSIKTGVPQGSILGPTLYSLYTADAPELEHGKIYTFADDTVIMETGECIQQTIDKLMENFSKLKEWMDMKLITVNADKSSNICFTLNKSDIPVIEINNVIIPQREGVKYLGIILNKKLTWGKHIQETRRKMKLLTKTFYWLINKGSKLKVNLKQQIYTSLIKPIWTYGIPLWATASRTNIKRIETEQAKILRLIRAAPWYVNNEDIRKSLQVSSVNSEVQKYSSKHKNRIENHINPTVLDCYDYI
ncbi:hypothetical protein KPH14_012754 [Odynerus spinipes]|uniref:Reverse transcriptase domain-containing protein n=1 Tax=Odynerus spinipes TaxID=1348599 RepID=A0AAD9VHZ8_9HYME|nr:hypothetical protein KPH14_012754 [Odynerus spinipes]